MAHGGPAAHPQVLREACFARKWLALHAVPVEVQEIDERNRSRVDPYHDTPSAPRDATTAWPSIPSFEFHLNRAHAPVLHALATRPKILAAPMLYRSATNSRRWHANAACAGCKAEAGEGIPFAIDASSGTSLSAREEHHTCAAGGAKQCGRAPACCQSCRCCREQLLRQSLLVTVKRQSGPSVIGVLLPWTHQHNLQHSGEHVAVLLQPCANAKPPAKF